ncbi:aminotransferase class III-fold pyridoxal phosphate-dependent enzyme [Bdellovibrio sp. HCB337]|uniref:aminotransferase class III-fold pyridoxal phosphate-dependent enzyme n=1 Tax=Bdellovibrio sp. HCB337 TaxID=3394358 RepID=UPI0039A74101
MKPLSQSQISDILIEEISSVAGLAREDVFLEKGFAEMGIESLQAANIIDRVGKRIGKDIDVAMMFDHPNILSLAKFLSNTSVNTLKTSSAVHSEKSSEPLAVVGMSCHFPKAASLQEFFELLSRGEDAISEAGVQRWGARAQGATKFLGAIDGFEKFPADVFGISDSEALSMDPQQRLLLEHTWYALEDAGYTPRELRGARVGVFVGISASDYSFLLKNTKSADIFAATGNAHSIAANRVSYFFDFKGPSVAVDTACSSSLVAADLAFKSLSHGDVDIAIVAGVNLVLLPDVSEAFAQATMLSPQGRCKTFSKDANGYVRGEGVGVVVLKRVSAALAAKDRIYSVIKSTAVNQDGKSSGLTAPNGSAQEAVIQEALNKAQLLPEQIHYHEAHGTATSLGDPVEMLALQRVHHARSENEPLYVGSVKTNIGHLESAAGIAGLIKVSLSLYYKKIFPHLHLEDSRQNLNPQLMGKISRLHIPTVLGDWPISAGPLRASVSSFGFGGTNSHAILEEAPTPVDSPTNIATNLNVFPVLMGFSSNTMQEAEAGFREVLSTSSFLDPRDLAQQGLASLSQRLENPERILAYIHREEDAGKLLTELKSGGTSKRWVRVQRRHSTPPKITLFFTGQGSQYTGMYEPLYTNDPHFRKHVDGLLLRAQMYFPLNLYSVWKNKNHASDLAQTDYGQILLFVFQLALAQTLTQKYQLHYDVLFGHSLGEIIAAVFSGVMSEDEGISLVAYRGRLMRKTNPGGMIAVFAAEEKLKELIPSNLKYDVAAFNGPELQVLSADQPNIDAIEKHLTENKTRHRRMIVQQAFHSWLMDPVLERFHSSIRNFTYRAPTTPLVSSMTGSLLEPEQVLNADYWVQQLRNPTQFLKAVRSLEEYKTQVFVELGPQPTLNPMAQRFSSHPKTQWVHFFEKNSENLDVYLPALLKLLGEGWAHAKSSQRVYDLPKSRFAKKSYWLGTVQKQEVPVAAPTTSHRREEILSKLVEIVASVMRIPADEVPVSENLVDIGADSLVLMNALQMVKDVYHVNVPVADVFKDLNSLMKIADYVHAELPQESATPATVSPTLQFPSMTGATVPNDVLQVIQQQMQIMNQQLALLQGQGVAPSAMPTIDTPSATKVQNKSERAFSSLGKEQRGVLGNFKNAATKEKSKEETREKELLLKNFIEKFNKKTKKTKDHVQKYRQTLADNRVSAGFRPNTKEMIYPIHFEQAKGSQFTDIDGNKYVDFTMGFGVNLFGHSPDFIETVLLEQIRKGMAVGPQSSLAGEVSALISELTGQERVAFVNSGTEAVMTAIRLARAATKRRKIVIFDGSYHGHFDGVLARGTRDLKSIPVAAGITEKFVDDIVVLEYGHSESLKVIQELGEELAAVLVEPVQSRFPENQPRDFLHALRKITADKGIAFIWDEVITGFRIHNGGAQAHFGVKADLASYGKVLGGGLPIGAVAGASKYMDFIDGGYWKFGDESYPGNDMTFFAGTFCKHPLAMAASLAVLKKLKTEGSKLIPELNERTAKLCADMNKFFEGVGLEIRLNNFGSLFRFKANLNLDLMFAMLNEQGFYIWEGRNLFMSTAHTDEDITRFKKTIEDITKELIKTGFFPSQNQSFISHQERFSNLTRVSEFGSSASNICVSAKVKGHLDLEKLEKALQYLAARRDLFRWRADVSSNSQWFENANAKVPFQFTSLREEKRPWKALDDHLYKLSQIQFQLKSEVPMRVHVYDAVEETHVMAIVCHHLAFDGWTMTLFFEDLATVYNAFLKNEDPQLRETLPYDKFLKSRQEWSQPERQAEGRQYWHQQFTTPVKLPSFEKQDVADLKTYKGQRIVFDLDIRLYKGLKKYCQANKLTPFMFLLGAFTKTLMQKFAKEEIVIGVPAANRDHQGSDKMYGNCANVLPVRIKGNTPEPAVFYGVVKSQLIQAYQNMNYPYEELRKEISSVFDVYFNLEPTSDLPKFDQASLIIYPFPIAASEYPLMLNITDFEHYYHCEFDFQFEYLTDDTVLELMDELKKTIKAILGPLYVA